MTMDRRRPSFCTPTARPHFFKIILDETSRETKLRLPYKFIKNYGAELSNSAYLKVQGGSRWEVEVTRSDRKVWFEKGWPNFADFYSIDYGYFLVFGYEGNSKFVVCIFDKTAMEIDYPISEDEDDDGDSSDEILEDFPKGSMTSEEESPLPNSDSHKKYRKGSTRKTEINPSIHILDDDNEDDESHDSSDEDSSSEGNEEEEEEEEEDTYGSEDMCSSSSEDEDPDYVEDGLKVKLHNRNNKTVGTKESNIRHVGELSRNQKFSKQRVLKVPGRMEEIAFQRAKDFKSIDPHFVVQIGRSTTRGCYLHVPSVFAETYLRKQPCYIILRAVSNEKTWSVGMQYGRTYSRLQSGLVKFMRDNKLLVGDACVFVLKTNLKYLFDVVFFRAT